MLEGLDLLALSAIFASVISSFFTQNRGGGIPQALPLDPPLVMFFPCTNLHFIVMNPYFKVCINSICWSNFRVCSGTDHYHSWCFMRWCSTYLGWNIAYLRLSYYFFWLVHLSYLLLNVKYAMMSFSRVSSFSDLFLVPEKENKNATKF